MLDETRGRLALLSLANLSAGFALDGAPNADDAPDEPIEGEFGCEDDTSIEDRFDPTKTALTDVDEDYLYVDDARLLIVTTAVHSFGDEATAQAQFDVFAEPLDEECMDLLESTQDPSSDLDFAVDGDTATDDVDQQLNLRADGLFKEEGQPDFEVGLAFTIARIGNNVVRVDYVSFGVRADIELIAPYTEIAVDRLVAVAAGETPEDVVGPPPTVVPPARLPGLEIGPTTIDFYAIAPGILGG